VAAIRKELGIRTVFNILGPLTNPAGANAQLIGVYDPSLLEPMARSAHNLGVKNVMTVYGLDGVDEISIADKTRIVKISNGSSTMEELDPAELGFKTAHPADVAGYDVDQNARLTLDILSGSLSKDDPRLQMVLANCAAGLVICEVAKDMKEGIEIAANAVSVGDAYRKLIELVEYSGGQLRDPKL
jgi:anthranilate phosphoribosyltransferase